MTPLDALIEAFAMAKSSPAAYSDTIIGIAAQAVG